MFSLSKLGKSVYILVHLRMSCAIGETLCPGCQWKCHSKTACSWNLSNIYLHSTEICRCCDVCIWLYSYIYWL